MGVDVAGRLLRLCACLLLVRRAETVLRVNPASSAGHVFDSAPLVYMGREASRATTGINGTALFLRGADALCPPSAATLAAVRGRVAVCSLHNAWGLDLATTSGSTSGSTSGGSGSAQGCLAEHFYARLSAANAAAVVLLEAHPEPDSHAYAHGLWMSGAVRDLPTPVFRVAAYSSRPSSSSGSDEVDLSDDAALDLFWETEPEVWLGPPHVHAHVDVYDSVLWTFTLRFAAPLLAFWTAGLAGREALRYRGNRHKWRAVGFIVFVVDVPCLALLGTVLAAGQFGPMLLPQWVHHNLSLGLFSGTQVALMALLVLFIREESRHARTHLPRRDMWRQHQRLIACLFVVLVGGDLAFLAAAPGELSLNNFVVELTLAVNVLVIFPAQLFLAACCFSSASHFHDELSTYIAHQPGLSAPTPEVASALRIGRLVFWLCVSSVASLLSFACYVATVYQLVFMQPLSPWAEWFVALAFSVTRIVAPLAQILAIKPGTKVVSQANRAAVARAPPRGAGPRSSLSPRQVHPQSIEMTAVQTRVPSASLHVDAGSDSSPDGRRRVSTLSQAGSTLSPSVETPRSHERRSISTQSLDEAPSPRDDDDLEDEHYDEEISDEEAWRQTISPSRTALHKDEEKGVVEYTLHDESNSSHCAPPSLRRVPEVKPAKLRVPLSSRELRYQLTQPPDKWAPDALRTWLKEYFSEARFRDRGLILGENSFESGLSGFDAIRMSKEEWREEVGATGLEASKVARELTRLQADGLGTGLDAERRSVSRRRDGDAPSTPEPRGVLMRRPSPLLDPLDRKQPHSVLQRVLPLEPLSRATGQREPAQKELIQHEGETKKNKCKITENKDTTTNEITSD